MTPIEIGRRVRGIRLTTIYPALPLAARAAWIELSLLANERPEVRRPVGVGLSVEKLTEVLAAEADEGSAALRHLLDAEILQPVEGGGFRLARY